MYIFSTTLNIINDPSSSTFFDVLRRTSAAFGNISPPPPPMDASATELVERDPVKAFKAHDLGRDEDTPGPLTPSRSESLNLSPTWVTSHGERG